MLQAADSLELTTDVELAGGVEEVLDGRVSLIIVTENLCSLESPWVMDVNDATQITCVAESPANSVERDRTHLSGL